MNKMSSNWYAKIPTNSHLLLWKTTLYHLQSIFINHGKHSKTFYNLHEPSWFYTALTWCWSSCTQAIHMLSWQTSCGTEPSGTFYILWHFITFYTAPTWAPAWFYTAPTWCRSSCTQAIHMLLWQTSCGTEPSGTFYTFYTFYTTHLSPGMILHSPDLVLIIMYPGHPYAAMANFM